MTFFGLQNKLFNEMLLCWAGT